MSVGCNARGHTAEPRVSGMFPRSLGEGISARRRGSLPSHGPRVVSLRLRLATRDSLRVPMPSGRTHWIAVVASVAAVSAGYVAISCDEPQRRRPRGKLVPRWNRPSAAKRCVILRHGLVEPCTRDLARGPEPVSHVGSKLFHRSLAQLNTGTIAACQTAASTKPDALIRRKSPV